MVSQSGFIFEDNSEPVALAMAFKVNMAPRRCTSSWRLAWNEMMGSIVSFINKSETQGAKVSKEMIVI